MAVTIFHANQVRRLGRENLTVAQIAVRLGLPEAEIMEVLTMLGLPPPGETLEERASPTDEERDALLAKLPKQLAGSARAGQVGRRTLYWALPGSSRDCFSLTTSATSCRSKQEGANGESRETVAESSGPTVG